MKLRRWLTSGALALVMALGCLVGSASFRAEEVSILMPSSFTDASAELVKTFNREHRGRIHLNLIRGPLNTESISDLAISSLLLGDAPFDALLMDVTWLPKYAAAGWLEPLDHWFDQADQEQLVEGARLGNDYDGHLYRWPLVADVGLLYWRTDLMKEPPKTPDELVSVAGQLVQTNAVANGFVWQGRQYEGLSCDFLEVLQGFGGEWMDTTTNTMQLDTPEATRAAAWLNDLINEGISPYAVTNYAESESLQAFKSGDAALMRNWPYAWAELQKDDSNVKGNVGISLMVAQPGERPGATLGSWGLSLMRQSPHQEAAVEAIRYLTNEASQRARFLNNGYSPTQANLFSDPEMLKSSPVLPELQLALNNAVVRPPTPLYAQLSDVVQRELNGLFTETGSADEAMATSQQRSQTLLRAAGATP
ncbi:ABC transporter substrate-binding protein [Synechococcus sp. HB1133]|uniref:ABC transporter substrate-binding protein n=1 Tax=unclassified Synechococcus TaxID=2626047 RepID=UPI0014084463|nr:ABC transporter substrate-binding protein [Synechococcus sp. PH41509]MCB4421921.1 ABC transporter substrate-binding protein [Synechococcus sp. HB1133]MCB4430132.1 ABC transporter substrate-binding protein [Synechococcus sp. HBA1120]NHI80863.1 ABC transporter substrate-binding protein [Synechococcus sp. HB1133]